jgi:hypothetical protein
MDRFEAADLGGGAAAYYTRLINGGLTHSRLMRGVLVG